MRRISFLVCIVFLLLAGAAIAEEKGHMGEKGHTGETGSMGHEGHVGEKSHVGEEDPMGHKGHMGKKGHTQLKFKEYPISEEFRRFAEPHPKEDPVFGKAGDYVVKKSDVARVLTYYPPETRNRLLKNPAEMQTLVKRLLEAKIVADVARTERFDQIPQIKKQLDYLADDLLSREYLARVVMKDVTVSEADLIRYYNENKKQLGMPEQVRARHILFRVEPSATEPEKNRARRQAEAVLKRAKAGEDFEELAQAYSDDERSKADGGDLGYFTQRRTLEGFEEVAFHTNSGEISDIVETKYGYHIIKVEDHVDAQERSFEEMRDYIRDEVQRQMAASKVQEFIREASENVGMEVYSERIHGE